MQIDQLQCFRRKYRYNTLPSGYPSIPSSSSQSHIACCQIGPVYMHSSTRTQGLIHWGHLSWCGCVLVNKGPKLMSLAPSGIGWGVVLIGNPVNEPCCTWDVWGGSKWVMDGGKEGTGDSCWVSWVVELWAEVGKYTMFQLNDYSHWISHKEFLHISLQAYRDETPFVLDNVFYFIFISTFIVLDRLCLKLHIS